MLSILIHLILNPGFAIGIGIIAVAAAIIYFTMGPVQLLKIALDIRVWFIAAFFLVGLAYLHSEKRADDLEASLKQAATQQTATTDAGKTTDLRVQQKTKRQTQTTSHQASISNASPGQAEDDLLDAIAQDHGAPAVAPAQPVATAQPVPAGGVRNKPVDGTVNP